MNDETADIRDFTDSMDTVTNGVTMFLSFDQAADESFRDGLSAFLLDGRFTRQMFRIDELRDRLNYATFDTDSNTFVYPPIANYFVREPLDLDLEEVEESDAVEAFVSFLTSTKSPYGAAMSPADADALLARLLAAVDRPSDDHERRFYRIEPNFLFARGDDEVAASADALPYFDDWYFDSATGVRVGPRSHLILTNGFP